MSNARTILLSGQVDEALTYKVGAVVDIKRGIWEMSLISTTFFFSQTVYSSLIMECNYIECSEVLKTNETYLAPMKLAVIQCQGRAKTNKTIGFKCRDWLKINHPQEYLHVNFSSTQPGVPLPKGVTATVLLMLRKVA